MGSEQELFQIEKAIINLSTSNGISSELEFNFEAEPYEPPSNAKDTSSKKNTAQKLPQSSITRKEEEVQIQRDQLLTKVKETKECINIVFIGHVDAGKSTIGGNLLYLTGMVDQRTLEKYQKEAREKNRESWYLSWALDTNTEERDRGKTVEIGRGHFETPNKHIIVIDAPGHKSFVPNMIGGTAQADVGILVISARKGEFETGFDKGGQTREHAQIAKIIGLKKLLVVINKMDDQTVEWNKERYDKICDRLNTYLKTIGWKVDEVFFMPVSGLSGANLLDPYHETWWNGPSLVQYLDQLPPLNCDLNGPPMVIISERYKDMGLVGIGKVISGYFSNNDTLVVMPVNKTAKISSILTMNEEEKSVAKIGENIKMRILNIDEKDLLPGFVLSSPSFPCSSAVLFDAQVYILDCPSIYTKGFKSIMHLHNAVEEVSFDSLLRIMDRKTHEWSKNPRFVKQDSICVIKMKLNNPVCVATYETFPALGRFSLRGEGKTIAVGKVLKLIS